MSSKGTDQPISIGLPKPSGSKRPPPPPEDPLAKLSQVEDKLDTLIEMVAALTLKVTNLEKSIAMQQTIGKPRKMELL